MPGVTTIAGAYKDPGPLMYWAWKQGCDGKDFRESRDTAATVGHLVHAAIEADLHGRASPALPVDLPTDDARRVSEGMSAYLAWRAGVSLRVLDTERPLVSELHRFGGTYDALALVNGRVALLDWKTGSGVYPEVLAQLAAYRQLIRESVQNARDLAPDVAYCLRVGKEMGDFHYHMYTSEILDAGWARFQASKWLHETDKILKKVCS